MNQIDLGNSIDFDELDMKIIQCLSIYHRAPVTVLSQVLGASEQTIGRRYRRLVSEGILRISGLVGGDDTAQSTWTLRLRCSAQSADQICATLARRADVSWVSIAAGGSEIICNIHCRTMQDRESLLLNRLPKTRAVDRVYAHEWIHRFGKTKGADWQAYGDHLTDAQFGELSAQMPAPPPAAPRGRTEVLPEDLPMLNLLAVDGRTSVARLAQATHRSHGRTARRLDALVASGTLVFDIDLAYELLGFRSLAYLWLTVHPQHLAEGGQLLADQPEVPFVVAITGTANLLASVVCRTAEDLYAFITTKVRLLEGLTMVETSPVIRTVKQAGALRNGLRLAVPSAAPGEPAAG
ncbi:Lrp/AsnC family transcriptional regulator [Nocardia mexicana]|uniref:DNA-binding Lrp family transcriptional regulator n=1 Tax=Nocardia mexicana TaxID=279262 RepID=A0A370H5H9_9NOCA|nr:Lrp/AsnC family transcriptional regulator [Nocardia mexicana]RDI51636.1 DNA-binding Lrp family transcriptional regulator [Nocardia mexicana]